MRRSDSNQISTKLLPTYSISISDADRYASALEHDGARKTKLGHNFGRD